MTIETRNRKMQMIQYLVAELKCTLDPNMIEDRESAFHPEWNLGSVSAVADARGLVSLLSTYVADYIANIPELSGGRVAASSVSPAAAGSLPFADDVGA